MNNSNHSSNYTKTQYDPDNYVIVIPIDFITFLIYTIFFMLLIRVYVKQLVKYHVKNYFENEANSFQQISTIARET